MGRPHSCPVVTRKVVALLPLAILHDPTIQQSGGYFHLPTYRLWVRKKEYALLASSARFDVSASYPPPEAGALTAPQQNACHPLQSGGLPPPPVAASAPPPPVQRTQLVGTGASAPSKDECPPPPVGDPEPGWQTIGMNFNDQWFWNGQEWTAHRRWIPRQWVEDPQGQG